MRSILVNADRQPGSDARVDAALELARHLGAHITALVDTPISRYVAMDPMGGSYVISEALEIARSDDDAAAEAVEARLAVGGVPFEVLRSEDNPVPALAAAARLCDLVVLSQDSGIVGEVALAARAPVLALPAGEKLALPIRRAVIAWDGGEQSASALKAAVPLLGQAEYVKVVTVTEKPGGYSAMDALGYLSRYGIHATFEEVPRNGSTEEALAGAVAQNNADLLVMGAYGKSRMREFLFGGVTAHFLSRPSTPALLFAH